MPDVMYFVVDNPTFIKDPVHLGDITITYWQGTGSETCDVCGDNTPFFCRLDKDDIEKSVHCCETCLKPVVKRWSKE